jgi:hypothetical protein
LKEFRNLRVVDMRRNGRNCGGGDRRPAQDLIDLRVSQVVPIESGDHFFSELQPKVEAVVEE